MKKGFTLIELIVAIGLFGVSSTIIAGMLLSMVSIQNRAIAIRSTMDNLGFALEIMSKDIRTGSAYPASCNPCSEFSFTSAYDVANAGGAFLPDGTPDTVYYRNNSNRFEKKLNGGAYLPLTAPEVRIDRLRFYVTGASATDDIQPMVTVVVSASAGRNFDTKINLQTTISQRRIDY